MNRHYINVSGYDYRQDDLRSLLDDENYEWSLTDSELKDHLGIDEKVYQFERTSYPLHIQAEPTCEWDPQAVQVYAGNVFVGYVPRGCFPEVKAYGTLPGSVARVEIYGGPFKKNVYEEDEDYLGTLDSEFFTIERDESPFRAVMVFEWP